MGTNVAAVFRPALCRRISHRRVHLAVRRCRRASARPRPGRMFAVSLRSCSLGGGGFSRHVQARAQRASAPEESFWRPEPRRVPYPLRFWVGSSSPFVIGLSSKNGGTTVCVLAGWRLLSSPTPFGDPREKTAPYAEAHLSHSAASPQSCLSAETHRPSTSPAPVSLRSRR